MRISRRARHDCVVNIFLRICVSSKPPAGRGKPSVRARSREDIFEETMRPGRAILQTLFARSESERDAILTTHLLGVT